jgi:hypothetical protein
MKITNIIGKYIRISQGVLQSISSQIGWLIVGKIIALSSIAIYFTIYPAYFDLYARTSIASSLLSTIALAGLPYTVQMWSQDSRKLSVRVLSSVSLFYISSSILVLSLFDYDSLMLFSVSVSGLSALWMSHLTQVCRPHEAHIVHFFFVALSQPLIYTAVVFLPVVSLSGSIILQLVCLTLFLFALLVLFRHFSDYGSLFFLQSLTVLIGSGLVTYILSSSIMEDKLMQAGFLWFLVQVASVVMFFTNSMSFRLIAHFSAQFSDTQKCRTASLIFKGLVIFCVLIFCGLLVFPGAGPFCYALYLLSQGVSQIAGSSVLSLRSPWVQLGSSVISFSALAIFLIIFGGENTFLMGVQSTLIASLGGACGMILLLRVYKDLIPPAETEP